MAQNKWLELNNNEMLNYPTVRTLNSMSQQGNYIGMTQGCKCFLETDLSTGAITKRVVHQSGYGVAGNSLNERRLLWEVLEGFLGGDCFLLWSDNTRYLF